MTTPRILIVDDEHDMLELLRRSLAPDLNCRLSTAASAKAALQLLSEQSFDLALIDIKMPEMDGLELLELIKRKWPDLTVVMMTAYGTIETAVYAMKQGAYDFITKPFDHETLLVRLEKALERSTLLAENRRLKQTQDENGPHIFHGMVGKSTAMQRVFETIQMVAATDLTVLITGESGTGKDLAGRAVHALSHRGQSEFLAVNCPTVPEQILESELFGYKKGAFTHATQNKIGLFQQANGGSIFLDEIGDISPSIQTKLLRVLQEKEIKPLGDTRTVTVDVRIIASTNQDLKGKIRAGQFREDFYYRLNVLPIELPPLRKRPEDIPLIADHLFNKHCHRLNKPDKAMSPELISFFQACYWEGNVRQLENLIIQSILFSTSDIVKPDDLAGNNPAGAGAAGAAELPDIRSLPYKTAKENVLQTFNTDYIGALLTETAGNVTQAAKICGMERQALQQIMRRYNISAEDYRQ
ncbi:MAG: sigma-54 dependent transcriptional regulator [Desulfobacterales bacterium]|nr:sigma-54 dependent transcriptional regulator [Desulfobacterales bacterium]